VKKPAPLLAISFEGQTLPSISGVCRLTRKDVKDERNQKGSRQ
jgi:hypothetical protein